MVKEMFDWGNIQLGTRLSGEMSGRGSLRRGNFQSGNCPFRKMSIWDVPVGELSLGDMPSRNGKWGTFQSRYCPLCCIWLYVLIMSHTGSFSKWVTVRLRTKWSWVRVLLQSLKLQILYLFQARSSLIIRQL